MEKRMLSQARHHIARENIRFSSLFAAAAAKSEEKRMFSQVICHVMSFHDWLVQLVERQTAMQEMF